MDNRFDDIIRQRLKDYQAPLDTSSWDLLNARMESGNADLSYIDDLAKGSLSNLVVDYDEASWDLMENKMEQIAAEDAARTDWIARKALTHLSVPYNPESWQVLSHKLDHLSFQRRTIAAKVAEMTMIFLALVTVLRFLAVYPSDVTPAPVQQQQFAQSDTYESSEPVVAVDDIADVPEQINTQTQLTADVTTSAVVSSPNTSRGSTPTKSIARLASRDFLSDIHEAHMLESMRTSTLSQGAFLGAWNARRETNAQASPVALRDHFVHVDKRPLDYHPLMQQVAILPMAEQPGVIMDESGIIQQLMQPITDIGVTRLKTKVQAYRQFNRHIIENFTGYGTEIDDQRLSANAFGMGAVIEFGKVSLDLGFVYDNLTYDALLGQNEIHKVQTPIHLRFAFYKTDEVQVYVKGGASYHGVMRADYQEPLLRGQSSGNNTPNPPKYNDGLLQGGFLKGYSENNTYLTYNAGIGVELPIWNNFALFSEAMIQNFFGDTRLGYSADEISTKSLNIGVSYTFDR